MTINNIWKRPEEFATQESSHWEGKIIFFEKCVEASTYSFIKSIDMQYEMSQIH